MTGRTRLVALCVLGLQLFACARFCYAEDGVSAFELSGPVVPADLPVKRLAGPASGWKLAGYNAVASPPVVDTSKGVLEVIINHKPIKGITPAMVQWMYSNLHKTVNIPASLAGVYGAKSAPMFQLLHPVDHISLATESADPTAPITVGSTLNWMEIPAAGCSYTAGSTTPWTCPTGRKGFTATDSPSLYNGHFYTKTTNNVIQADINGFKTLKTVDSILGPLATSYSGHSWAPSKGMLNVKSVYRIGLVTSGGDGEYYLATDRRYLNIINGRVADAFVNGEPFSAEAQGQALLLHSIQEWQRLPQWLPAVYAANQKA